MGRRAVSRELVTLGESIRSRRAELRLSQEALAEKAGISANTVSRIEGGQMAMGIETFLKLVEAMEADANDLLGIVWVKEPDRERRNILYRVSRLEKREQEIVMRTVGVLMDELHRGM